MPEFKRHGEGADLPIVHSELAPADLHPELKRHIFAVTRRWMDPLGNGDISQGVDGFRLDVAELIPAAFWRDYRKFVRSINSDAYLVGELWWDDWPDKLLNPNPWLQGDIFDANMNYRWYMPTRSYFGLAEPAVPTPTAYIAHIDSVSSGVSRDVLYAQMNLTSSHDSPRFMTSMLNRGQYKYRVNPRENRRYLLKSADAVTKERMHLLLVKQFTDVGAPHIWMGDEMGMWGADDPDTRKPLIWNDLEFDDESADPFNRRRSSEPVRFDEKRFKLYQELIDLRKTHSVLRLGGKTYTLADDGRNILAYERYSDSELILVLINNDDSPQRVSYFSLRTDSRVVDLQSNPSHDWDLRNQLVQSKSSVFTELYKTHDVTFELHDGEVHAEMPARSAIVLKMIP